MADILERIRNPLLRATTAALMGASAVTIVAGGILGFTSLEKALIHRLSLYGGGAGAVLGALAGLAGVRPVAAKPTTQSTDRPDTGAKDTAAESGWQGWRSLVVKRKVQESAEITSFYLEPEDGQSLPGFVPGQFLTIKLDIPDQPRPVIRTYSLSDYAENPTYYRLSIKREAAPKDQDVPPGIASNFMHDRIQAGSVVAAKPPAGKFVLANVASDRPVSLISNGVGITPMISMAKAVQGVNPNRLVWFLHGARNGAYHAFRDSIVGLAQQTPGLTVHYRYSRPVPEDEGHYQDTGYVDVDLVKTCLGPDRAANDAEYYLCGSPAFMDSLRSGLAAAGVGGDRVFFESFSKPPKGPVASATVPAADGVKQASVVFAKTGKTATWTAADGTLLDFAEAQGLDPAYSCRAGICLTCMCRLEGGEIAYQEPPTGTPDDGSVLICVAKPNAARVVLDL